MDSTLNSSAVVKKIECPFAIKWEIEEDKLVALKDSENGFLETQWFEASNIPVVQYSLEIYPNGFKEENRGQVWIVLHFKIGIEKKIKAEYKVCIDTADFIYKCNYEFEKSVGWGGTRFTTTELFNPDKKFIFGGKLILKFQGTLCVERQVAEADTTNKWKDQSFLGKVWETNSYYDFTIIVDGKKIKAHKCILAAHSTAFDGMFNSGMIEAVENKMEIIDFSYETVELAIQLMYERKISTLTLEEKMDVLRFFDNYVVQGLKDSLELSLAETISPTSVVVIANGSIAANSNLKQRCMDFMVASFRMDQLIDDFDNLNETFALKVFKNTFFDIVKT